MNDESKNSHETLMAMGMLTGLAHEYLPAHSLTTGIKMKKQKKAHIRHTGDKEKARRLKQMRQVP